MVLQGYLKQQEMKHKKRNIKREKKQIRQINYVIKTVNFKLIYKWMKGIIINNYYLIRNKYEINKDNK